MVEYKTEPKRLYRGYQIVCVFQRRLSAGGRGRPGTGKWYAVEYKVLKGGVEKFTGKKFRDVKLWVDTKGVKHTEI